MTIKARIDPIDREIALMIDETLSPAARSKALADFALDEFVKAEAINTRATGSRPAHRRFVDGREGAALDTVRPDGVIVFEFEALREVLVWIDAELVKASPVLTGTYAKSHVLFADGIEIDVAGTIPSAQEYVFLNVQPYARKIERGRSKKAPDGVYEAVASLADDRFDNIARIRFTFRAPFGSSLEAKARRKRGSLKMASEAARAVRQPAIIVRSYGGA